MSPVNVLLLWHMHQPDYRDPETNRHAMPWVRLHATRGYYDMARVLDRVGPAARAIFNLVPVLVRQIEGYVDGTIADEYLEIARKPVADLVPDERRFVVRNFFHANRRTMIDCYPRYAELRVRASSTGAAERALNDRDLRDLVVWFNLTWFGYSARHDFPRIGELIRQGENYTDEQRDEVLDIQLEVMRRIIPIYRDLAAAGRIELTATPFYHPILPLLCDTSAAKKGLPDRPLPDPPLVAPEDAAVHVRRAIEFHAERFGAPPAGMWPAEGSVSPAAIEIFAAQGIRWIATDQEVLFRSDAHLKPADLYEPYTVGTGDATVSVFFRDTDISNAIGFRYSQMSAEAAVDDFMGRLRAVRAKREGTRKTTLVSVILDGENPWEYYPDSGESFLLRLYRTVAESKHFAWTTASEYLAKHPPERRIRTIFSGSWIGGTFDIWIGSESENRGWSQLRAAREVLVAAKDRVGPDILARAWETLYSAEGSDWFWWYGDDFSSPLQVEFDRLFRARIMEIYRLLGQPVPRNLFAPNVRGGRIAGVKPANLITPTIDGRSTSFYEWEGAGRFDALRSHGAMAVDTQIVGAIHYGVDQHKFYLRIDAAKRNEDAKAFDGIEVACEFPSRPDLHLAVGPIVRDGEIPVALAQGDRVVPAEAAARVVSAFECAVPLIALGFAPGSAVDFAVVLRREGAEVERWPRDGLLSFDVLATTWDLDHWTV